MAETFTSTSRVQSVYLSFNPSPAFVWSYLGVIDSDGDDHRHIVNPINPAEWGPAADGTLLKAIRDNYADGGFLNADGDPVLPQVDSRFSHSVTTPEDVEKYGYVNILDDTSYDRLVNAGNLAVDHGRDTARRVNADGSIDHMSQVGAIPEKYTPSGTSQTAEIMDWIVTIPDTDHDFNATVAYPRAAGYTIESPEIVLQLTAMESLLRAAHHSGDEPGDDFDTTGFGGSRVYRAVIDSTNFDFQIQEIEVGYYDGDDTDVVFFLAIRFHEDTDDTLDRAGFEEWVNTTQTVPVVENSVPPAFGSLDVPVLASEIRFAGGQKVRIKDNYAVLRLADGTECPLTANNSGVFEVDELIPRAEDAANSIPANSFWMPKTQSHGHVHFKDDPAANPTLYFDTPNKMTNRGVSYQLLVRNFTTEEDRVVEARLWDNSLIAQIHQSADADFHVTHERDGTGEIVANLTNKKLLTTRTTDTAMNTWTRLVSAAGTTYERIIPYGAQNNLAPEVYDNEAGRPDAPDTAVQGIVEMLADARVDFTLSARFEIRNPASGYISQALVRLNRWRAGETDEDNHDHVRFFHMDPANLDGEYMVADWTSFLDVRAGDRFCFSLDYSGNMNESSVYLTQCTCEFECNPTIIKTWRP